MEHGLRTKDQSPWRLQAAAEPWESLCGRHDPRWTRQTVTWQLPPSRPRKGGPTPSRHTEIDSPTLQDAPVSQPSGKGTLKRHVGWAGVEGREGQARGQVWVAGASPRGPHHALMWWEPRPAPTARACLTEPRTLGASQATYASRLWRPGAPHRGVPRTARAPSRGSQGGSFPASSSSRGSRHSWACGHVTTPSASFFTWLLPVRPCVLSCLWQGHQSLDG